MKVHKFTTRLGTRLSIYIRLTNVKQKKKAKRKTNLRNIICKIYLLYVRTNLLTVGFQIKKNPYSTNDDTQLQRKSKRKNEKNMEKKKMKKQKNVKVI